MTSESAVDSNWMPCASRSSRRTSALVRLPLWARAIGAAGLAVVDDDRLGVAGERAAGGAVAGVADGDVATQVGEVFFVEDLRDEAHAGANFDVARPLLVAMPALSWPRCWRA